MVIPKVVSHQDLPSLQASKHFKTSFALKIASSYLENKKDSVLLFYDSEFGSPQSYFEQFNIPMDRVLHTPITNVEELKFDLIKQFEELDRDDNVIVVIDSIGNLASKKELEDALSEKSVADMSRAKALKGLFRMSTPYLKMKNIPLIAVNHTYKEIGLFPKDIVGGGTGIYYSADNIWIVGRQQDKSGTEIKGYHFIINIDKSRYVKEKSKIPISVSWEGGIQSYSGLLDVAVNGGYITSLVMVGIWLLIKILVKVLETRFVRKTLSILSSGVRYLKQQISKIT